MTDQSGEIQPIESGFPDEELERLLKLEEIENRLRQSDHTSVGPEELRERFFDHKPGDLTDAMKTAIQNMFLDGAVTLDRMLPNGRAKFQSLMFLEQACIWAKKAASEMTPVEETE